MKHLLLILIMISLVVIGCNGDGDTPALSPTPETSPVEDVVITIGNLSDLTGPSANPMEYINMALDDLVEYYNENNLIPGVRLEVVTYDGQMDPARDIPGYEWLIEKGADLIFTPIPATPVTLKSRVDSDKVVLFSMAADKDEILPPGYVFNLGTIPQYDAYTLLKWIAENDWDYKTNGPAKVGGVDWNNAHGGALLSAMEEYCSAHPDQFEWEGGYLTNYSFDWGAEVEALRNCDYVYPGIIMQSFVKQYREAGCTEAKFLGSDTQAAFFVMVDDAQLWDEIDGMFFLKFSRWWNEEGEIVNLAKKLLYENHPDEAESIIRSGVGYLAMNQIYPMLSIIADAAEVVGPQNLDSQVLYDAATSFVLTTDGVQRLSFGEEKRDAVDAYTMYEARGTDEDIFRLHDEWYPTVRNP
ncbi:MAG: ABC transporter substrate-binding protein [Chloroflexi bacterium]|nr:ABC transporter substrate-binding protein [Chloroflexota bacterium]